MAFVASPNCVQLALIGALDGQPVENTFHYRLPAPASLANLQALVTAADAYWVAHVARWPTNFTVTKFYARALDTINSPSFERNPAAPITGTNFSGTLPNNVSFAVTRYTGLAGRRNRGRVYWIGITDDDLTGANTMDSGRADGFVTYLEGFRTAMAAATPSATEVIIHKADGSHNDVIGYRYSDLFCDAQRRRLPAHNIHH